MLWKGLYLRYLTTTLPTTLLSTVCSRAHNRCWRGHQRKGSKICQPRILNTNVVVPRRVGGRKVRQDRQSQLPKAFSPAPTILNFGAKYNAKYNKYSTGRQTEAIKGIAKRAVLALKIRTIYHGVRQELRAQKAAENRRRTEMVRKQREDSRAKKEAEQRQREAKQQEEHRRRIAAEKKKVKA